MLSAAINALAAGPQPLRDLGAGLDLVSSTGIAYARQRRRERGELAGRSLGIDLYRDIWSEAARGTGAALEELGHGFFRLRRDGGAATTWLHEVPLDAGVTLRLALDKTLVHQLLVREGLPPPPYREWHYRRAAPALEFLQTHAPCVIKPASGGSGGEGATAGVRDARDLSRAALRASRGDSRLLIEQQVAGDVYRLLFLDGELLDTLRRLPPRLAGDGRSSLAELLAAENRRRLTARGHAGLRLLTLDLDAVLTLERAGLTLASVPAAGDLVQVKTVTNQNRVEDNETVREGVSKDLIAQCRRAAEAVGVRLAGVDIVTPDVSRPLAPGRGAIVEVNGTPGLHYHYQVADRERATRVAVPIAERLLS